MDLNDEELYFTKKKKRLLKKGIKMFKVTISDNGIIKEININANDYYEVNSIITNMFGEGKIQIINIRRI